LLEKFWQSRNDEKDRANVMGDIEYFNSHLKDHEAMKEITPDTLKKSLQERMGRKAYDEAGVPKVKSDRPIVQEIQRLYPGTIAVQPRR
jgi:hypothetical protein